MNWNFFGNKFDILMVKNRGGERARQTAKMLNVKREGWYKKNWKKNSLKKILIIKIFDSFAKCFVNLFLI